MSTLLNIVSLKSVCRAIVRYGDGQKGLCSGVFRLGAVNIRRGRRFKTWESQSLCSEALWLT